MLAGRRRGSMPLVLFAEFTAQLPIVSPMLSQSPGLWYNDGEASPESAACMLAAAISNGRSANIALSTLVDSKQSRIILVPAGEVLYDQMTVRVTLGLDYIPGC